MTVEEITEYLHQRKEQEVKEKHEKALAAKGELEFLCISKYGMTLAEIYMTSDKVQARKQYKNPADGTTYSYSGRGKVPGWLKGKDGKPNPDFEAKPSLLDSLKQKMAVDTSA